MLQSRHCVPCKGGLVPLMRTEAERLQKETPEWSIAEDGKSISRNRTFKNFKEAFAFVCEVADIAEFEGHHPDISISWNKVRLMLTTHAIGGLSENDFILAEKIDLIPSPINLYEPSLENRGSVSKKKSRYIS